MIKKTTALVLCLMMSINICSLAAETADIPTDVPTQGEFSPPEGMPPGGRGFGGGSRQRPQGDMAPLEEGMTPPRDGNMPDFNGSRNTPVAEDQAVTEADDENFFKKYFTPLFSMVLLGLAFLFVIFYKRKTF